MSRDMSPTRLAKMLNAYDGTTDFNSWLEEVDLKKLLRGWTAHEAGHAARWMMRGDAAHRLKQVGLHIGNVTMDQIRDKLGNYFKADHAETIPGLNQMVPKKDESARAFANRMQTAFLHFPQQFTEKIKLQFYIQSLKGLYPAGTLKSIEIASKTLGEAIDLVADMEKEGGGLHQHAPGRDPRPQKKKYGNGGHREKRPGDKWCAYHK